jgi:hypothetical protein
MKNEVRQRIIDFVTEPEFSKAFGSKKWGYHFGRGSGSRG